MPAKTERVPLIESYDRNYGFLTDAIIEKSQNRTYFCPRPSVQKTIDMGVFSPSGLPSDLSASLQIDAFFVFDIVFPYTTGTAVYINQTVTYATWLYRGTSALVGPANNVLVLCLYDITHGTAVGSYEIAYVYPPGIPFFGGRFTTATGSYSKLLSASIAQAGAGYSIGNVIAFLGFSIAVQNTDGTAGLTSGVVTNGGSGGTNGTFSLASIPAPPTGATATGTFSVVGGIVQSITITNPGDPSYGTTPINLTSSSFAASTGISGVTATLNPGGGVTAFTYVSQRIISGGYTNPVQQTSILSNTGYGTGTGLELTVSADSYAGVALVAYQGSTIIYLLLINLRTGLATEMSFEAEGGSIAFTPSVIDLSSYNTVLGTDGILYNSPPGGILNNATNDGTVVSGEWDGLAFTQAFSNNGTKPLTLYSHSGYLLAMGDNEIRFFLPSGAGEGSAWQPILNTTFGVGLLNPFCVTSLNEYLFFVGASDDYGTPVYMMMPNSQVPQRISYPYLEQQLALPSTTVLRADAVEFGGHIALKLSVTQGSNNLVYLFDSTTGDWYLWNPAPADASDCMRMASQNADKTYFIAHDVTSQHFYLLQFAPAAADTNYTASIPYTGTLITKPMDFGITNYKQFSKVTIVGDQIPNSPTPVNLSYQDDAAFSYTTPRSIDLSSSNPNTRNLGQGRRRRWQLGVPGNPLVRLESLEVTFEVAEQ